ncbi:MAG: AAC(3) family N-acetyltransferase [Anaerolinea sp.]|nr:AAC(3) family N-acetyltransferase [Anaerolinea sp.]
MTIDSSDLIARTPRPRTRISLAADLRALGLEAGMTVIVHSSLSRMGWVNGGALAVVLALQDVLTAAGTLVMPAHSGGISDPAQWRRPPVPAEWIDEVRATMPPYDPALSPTRGIGIIPEYFRTLPGVLRSAHPMGSFAAWGHHAAFITGNHSLECELGERSPLGKIYALDGQVLMIGTGYDTNTSFHLGEAHVPNAPQTSVSTCVVREGQAAWVSYIDVDYSADDFDRIGADFEASHPDRVQIGLVGSAETRLFRQRSAVDFAREWLLRHRPGWGLVPPADAPTGGPSPQP